MKRASSNAPAGLNVKKITAYLKGQAKNRNAVRITCQGGSVYIFTGYAAFKLPAVLYPEVIQPVTMQAVRCSGQAAGPAAGRWAKEKGQGRRRGVRCCSGLWSALAAMVPAGCVPVPVVGLICWRCRWAWSALALFQAQRFQRHGLRWRCSIRCVFAVCRRGQILHFTG